MQDHLTDNNLLELLQSAYKMFHSTETALLKVQNDILQATDSGKSTILVLLDLSAAFDTVDHEVLLNRLSEQFGIRGIALQWIRSYLTNRSQSVLIDGEESDAWEILFGVPQGSVLGPILFTLYSAPIGKSYRHMA